MKVIIIIFISVFIHGCAIGPKYTVAPSPPSGKALIYFMNSSGSEGLINPPLFCINDNKVAMLRSGGYTWIHFDVGVHEFKRVSTLVGGGTCASGGMVKDQVLAFKSMVKAGEKYIVNYSTKNVSYNKIRLSLEFVNFTEYESKIKNYKYKKSVISE